MTNDNGTAMAVRDEQSTAIANHEDAASALSHILGTGDLSKLTDEERVGHYLDVCSSLGLNPRTRPFDWIEFYDPQTQSKKLALYPNRSCAEQLRRQHQISVRVVRREPIGAGTDDAMFVVEVEGTTPTGRTGQAIKYVPLIGNKKGGGTYRLSGAALANAYMKAETGAFRRLTFSMVGMASPPDLDELSRPKIVVVDGTGRVLDNPTQEQKALAADPDLARAIHEPTFETVAAASDGPLAGHADQRPRPADLERPAARPAVSLYCDANKWRAAYFGSVADTDLETAEGRRQFLADYTANFTPALRTDSLSEFLAHASDRQAEEMVEAARARAEAMRGGSVSDASAEGQEEEPDDEAQYQADIEAELERERQAAF